MRRAQVIEFTCISLHWARQRVHSSLKQHVVSISTYVECVNKKYIGSVGNQALACTYVTHWRTKTKLTRWWWNRSKYV